MYFSAVFTLLRNYHFGPLVEIIHSVSYLIGYLQYKSPTSVSQKLIHVGRDLIIVVIVVINIIIIIIKYIQINKQICLNNISGKYEM
jgi:hypothetical protein